MIGDPGGKGDHRQEPVQPVPELQLPSFFFTYIQTLPILKKNALFVSEIFKIHRGGDVQGLNIQGGGGGEEGGGGGMDDGHPVGLRQVPSLPDLGGPDRGGGPRQEAAANVSYAPIARQRKSRLYTSN